MTQPTKRSSFNSLPVFQTKPSRSAESIATLPPFGPRKGHKWFDQISSQWESQKSHSSLSAKFSFYLPAFEIFRSCRTASEYCTAVCCAGLRRTHHPATTTSKEGRRRWFLFSPASGPHFVRTPDGNCYPTGFRVQQDSRVQSGLVGSALACCSNLGSEVPPKNVSYIHFWPGMTVCLCGW